jgi:DNA uptake protein ComE-like DNA-binding protein
MSNLSESGLATARVVTATRRRMRVATLGLACLIGVSGESLDARARRPDSMPATASPVQPRPGPAGSGQLAAPSAALVDINRATAGDLEALPGIGKALAAKIIGGRPYANKQQLVQRGILTPAVYDTVKDRLIAKR